MTGRTWLDATIVVAGSLALLWALLLVLLWLAKPQAPPLRASLRLVPDLLRLLGRLARDSFLPRGVRARLWLLLGYLALPVDLVPDFVPVLGYVDDVVVVALVLRSVVRRAGGDALDRHWPGSPDGLVVVRRLAGLTPAGTS